MSGMKFALKRQKEANPVKPKVSRHFPVITVLIVLSINLGAQNDNGWQLSGVSITATAWNQHHITYSQQKLLRQWSEWDGLFARDYQNFQYSGSNPRYNSFGLRQTYISASFQPNSATLGLPSSNQSLEVGIGFSSPASYEFKFRQESNLLLDTFDSDLGPVYKDSTYVHQLSARYQFEKYSLDVQYRLATDPLKRFHLYLSPAVAFDYYVSRQVKATYTERGQADYIWPSEEHIPTYLIGQDYTVREVQTKSLANEMGISTYLPIGLGIRFAKKYKYINKAYIFMEGRFGLNYRIRTNSRNTLKSMGGVTFGIRVWIPNTKSLTTSKTNDP